ncbi:hypothetical protein HY78_02430 [Rhizorhabdus wittichii DC-6]|nr:hypothetical protein HY78_02430 [Rhizorhabdus wittichii DC-6]
MMPDRMAITVPGTIEWRNGRTSPEAAGALIDLYREMLGNRGATTRGSWSTPSGPRERLHTIWHPVAATIEARLHATWAIDRIKLSLRLVFNPTRTLAYLMSQTTWADDGGTVDQATAIEHLRTMEGDRFWAAIDGPVLRFPLSDDDNVLVDLDRVRERLGSDYPRSFMDVMEHQLRLWSLEAVAPADVGFRHDTTRYELLAASENIRLQLRWDNLIVGQTEIYCERMLSGGVGVMQRIADRADAAHQEADWRAYEVDPQFGGRRGASKIVGVRPTKTVHVVIYAKASDRLRVEVRYLKNVLATLRLHSSSERWPLRRILPELQRDAAKRIDWKALCDMGIERPRPLLREVAAMTALISECVAKAKADPAAVFRALLTSGSIEEDGDQFKRSLMRRLADARLIERQSLMRRARPGQRRRHRLASPYFEIVAHLRSVFEEDTDDDASPPQ